MLMACRVDRDALDLSWVPLGNSDAVRLADSIDIFSYPAAGGESLTYTAGVVSGFAVDDGSSERAWINTDATISGGIVSGAGSTAPGTDRRRHARVRARLPAGIRTAMAHSRPRIWAAFRRVARFGQLRPAKLCMGSPGDHGESATPRWLPPGSQHSSLSEPAPDLILSGPVKRADGKPKRRDACGRCKPRTRYRC